MTAALKYTESRIRRAQLKARFTISQGYRLLAELEGLDLAVHICPVCHSADISKNSQLFICGARTDPRGRASVCGAQGDVVTLISEARQITVEQAMDLIEISLSGGRDE